MGQNLRGSDSGTRSILGILQIWHMFCPFRI